MGKKYTVEINKNGKSYEIDIDVPEGQSIQTSTSTEQPKQGFFSNMLGKAKDLVNWPEKKSKEGLDIIANAMPSPDPTGNLPMDILKGTPKIAAETLAETAPGFVSPMAMATPVALKALGKTAPLVKGGLEWLGKQGESFSNIKPGALKAAYKDSSLLFSKSKEQAAQMYKAMQKSGDPAIELMDEMRTHQAVIDFAEEYAKNKELSPMAARVARQSVDALYNSKTMPKGTYNRLRDTFDEIAKTEGKISEADKLYRDGLFRQSLLNLFPQNKTGGASPFRMMLGQLFSIGEGMQSVGKAMSILSSPLAQGTVATGAGMVERGIVSPIIKASIPSQMGFSGIVKNAIGKKKK